MRRQAARGIGKQHVPPAVTVAESVRLTRLRQAIRHGTAMVLQAFPFLKCWLTTRRWHRLRGGIPVLAVGLGCVAILMAEPRQRHRQETRYRRALAEALGASEWQRSAVICDKLLALSDDPPPYLFQRVLIYERLGERQAASSLLQRLAPIQTPGFAPAHALRAERALGLGNRQAAIAHLRHAVSRSPRQPAYRLRLGEALLGERQFDQAHQQLSRARQLDPSLAMRIGHRLAEAGMHMAARRAWQDAARHLRAKYAHSGARHDLLPLAEALRLTGDLAGAKQILDKAARRFGREALSEPLAKLYTAEAIAQASAKNYRAQWESLLRAIEVKPDHAEALVEVAKLAYRTEPEAKLAQRHIRQLLVTGTAPAAVHVVVGSLEAERGRLQRARTHLEQARQLSPRSPIVLNNLAWVRYRQDVNQAAAALQLINEAIRLAPHMAAMRDTRASLRLSLEDAAGAIQDLEDAVRLQPDQIAYSERLASVYELTGAEDAADAIRRQVVGE